MQSKIFPINGHKCKKLESFGGLLIDNETGLLFEKSTPTVMGTDGIFNFYKDDMAIGKMDMFRTIIDIFKGSLLVKKQIKLISKSNGQEKTVTRLLYVATGKPAKTEDTECHLFDNIYWCPFESGKEECYTMEYLKGLSNGNN